MVAGTDEPEAAPEPPVQAESLEQAAPEEETPLIELADEPKAPQAPATPEKKVKAPREPRPRKPRKPMPKWLKTSLITILIVATVAAVLLATFVVLAQAAPDFIDSLLYTPEELQILNYR